MTRLLKGLDVASFVVVDNRGSPCLGKLVEVSGAVLQAQIGQIKPANAIDVFILVLKARAFVVSAKGAPSGHAAAPIEWSGCREWAGGQESNRYRCKESIKSSVLLTQGRFSPLS
eukprot:11062932-Ditylum_brightwellii.AAC.1